jgi:5-methylcytosine-specific restriction endonuclease McrA
MPKPCSECESLTHSRFSCPNKPRKPLKTSTTLKPKKRMNKVGVTTKQWLAVRSKWLRENPPNYRGNYVCYLCGKEVWYTEITLDHVKSRSRHPELRLSVKNLQPCCALCNQMKGSRDLEEVLNDQTQKPEPDSSGATD